MNTRYFFISYGFQTPTNPLSFGTYSVICTGDPAFPNKKASEQQIKDAYKKRGSEIISISILNIVEMTESDYLKFNE